MKITKWVEVPSQEVEIDIGVHEIRAALSEIWNRIGPIAVRNEITTTLSDMAVFLNSLTVQHIDMLTLQQRIVVQGFLLKAADRFKPPEALGEFLSADAETVSGSSRSEKP